MRKRPCQHVRHYSSGRIITVNRGIKKSYKISMGEMMDNDRRMLVKIVNGEVTPRAAKKYLKQEFNPQSLGIPASMPNNSRRYAREILQSWKEIA